MIRLTRQADYAIVLLARIASGAPQGVHAASDLAAETKLPLPMVSKTLKALAREGLLHSVRGAKGGYSLSRPPGRISIADVVTALDGPLAMTECMATGGGDCEHQPLCQVQQAWKRINAVVIGALDGITLAELSEAPRRFVTLEATSPAPAR